MSKSSQRERTFKQAGKHGAFGWWQRWYSRPALLFGSHRSNIPRQVNTPRVEEVLKDWGLTLEKAITMNSHQLRLALPDVGMSVIDAIIRIKCRGSFHNDEQA